MPYSLPAVQATLLLSSVTTSWPCATWASASASLRFPFHASQTEPAADLSLMRQGIKKCIVSLFKISNQSLSTSCFSMPHTSRGLVFELSKAGSTVLSYFSDKEIETRVLKVPQLVQGQGRMGGPDQMRRTLARGPPHHHHLRRRHLLGVVSIPT